jgi:hypothetical protein
VCSTDDSQACFPPQLGYNLLQMLLRPWPETFVNVLASVVGECRLQDAQACILSIPVHAPIHNRMALSRVGCFSWVLSSGGAVEL